MVLLGTWLLVIIAKGARYGACRLFYDLLGHQSLLGLLLLYLLPLCLLFTSNRALRPRLINRLILLRLCELRAAMLLSRSIPAIKRRLEVGLPYMLVQSGDSLLRRVSFEDLSVLLLLLMSHCIVDLVLCLLDDEAGLCLDQAA